MSNQITDAASSATTNIGEETFQVPSTTFTDAYMEKLSKWQSRRQPIQNVIRLQNTPDATFDEFVTQAEVYITSRSYFQAMQCFTYALLRNDVEGEIVMTNRVDRMKLANIYSRKLWCQVQGEEGRKQHDPSQLKLLREDCAFLLDTGIFDLNELGPVFARNVNAMDNQVKAWGEELAALARRQRSRNTSLRKKKKSKKK